MNSLRKLRLDVERRLKEHDAARLVIEGELLAIQHACQHKHVREWNSTDYKCETDHYWVCEDCGLRKRN